MLVVVSNKIKIKKIRKETYKKVVKIDFLDKNLGFRQRLNLKQDTVRLTWKCMHKNKLLVLH